MNSHPADQRAGLPVARLATLATLASLLAALAGCAAPPVRDGAPPAVPVPAAWSASAVAPSQPADAASSPAAAPPSADGPGALARWWLRFDDPQLAALVAQALEVNARLRSARAALAQARALRDVQAAGLLPNLGASGSAQRARPAGGDTANRFQAGLDAGWELDVFGGRQAAVQAAEADARVAQENLAATQVSLSAEVALAYIELRGLQARLAIARGNLAAQAETLQLAQWRVQAGLASSVELEQARAATGQTAAQIPALEAAIAQARHALAALTGRAPLALRAQLDEARPLPQPAAALALSIPAETLRQRPDVRRAEQQVSAALARVSQADAARYPGFRLGGTLGLSALTLGGLGSSAAIFDSLLASVSVPLLDGGAARAQVRAQEAALEQARAGYESVVLGALQEVEDALVALAKDRERLVRLREAAEAAGNAALLAQQRYAGGLIDFQVVLETQRTLLATQDSVANTGANLGADHVRLFKALGGGWE
ncbi:MAG: efflux transporter outer membrane subunit [Burkholderiaceae bacterium]|nr:efflux transporter outer membrane subunit [Burkholderiaceae bacterium]MEB2350580.1 efflux transporter outer membrane subunit [Burkholderiaceae bacterium]